MELEEEEVELFREPRVLLNHEFFAAWTSFIRTPRWCSSSCKDTRGPQRSQRELIENAVQPVQLQKFSLITHEHL